MKYVTCTNSIVSMVYLYDPRNTVEDAIEAPDEVFPGWKYDGTTFTAPVSPPPSLEDRRAKKLEEVVAKAEGLLSAGAPVSGGLHVALDDGSRSDLTALAQTATNAMSGVLSWPDSYARGWITVENVRIPLATPATGLTLAASVGGYYAALVQHRRDLKDAVLAAMDAAALDAIDISTGWPT